jgi:hypothetical protein
MMNDPLELELEMSSLDGADFDARLLNAVIDHWHQCLLRMADRDKTLRRLGVTFDHAVEMRLGYCDRSLGTRIPNAQWKTGRVIRTRLQELGIMRSTGHEAFRGCVVVPIFGANGAVLALNAQRLTTPRREVWATGLPGGVFEMTSGGHGLSTHHGATNDATDRPAATVLITPTILDALAIVGTLDGADNESVTLSEFVVAPGRPKGFSAKDCQHLATRYSDVVVLGRGASALADKLRGRGLGVSVDVEENDLARVLTTSSMPRRALRAMLDEVTHVDAPTTKADETSAPSASHGDEVGPNTTSAPLATRDDVSAVVTPTILTTPNRDEVFVRYALRSWRIRGARARSNVDGDRLNIALSVNDVEQGRFHLDTLDLYAARQRAAFLDAAVEELRTTRDVLHTEMIEVISAAEQRRDDESEVAANRHVMSDLDRDAAITWLADPDLLDHVVRDLATLGVVGEETNLMLCYIATISRKCARPLGVLVQSSSAGGKSTLVDAVCSLVPPEDLVSLSAITAQALYYLGNSGLRHKVLSVAEETGSQRASYALKLLLSEGRLSIATPGTSASSGRIVTTNYETAGPVALVMTTTATAIDPELENRLVILGVNEDANQTAAIIAAQRRSASLDGLLNQRHCDELRRFHANAQRLLAPMPVVIGHFDAAFPSTSARHRRDHAKLLSIISAIALLHQFQREQMTVEVGDETITYLVASDDDIQRGVAIAREVLVRSSEQLAPQTARLLSAVREYTTSKAAQRGCALSDVDVTRRELREGLGWSDTQVRAATDRLVALEYLVVSGGGRGRCRTYSLVPDFGALDATAADTFEGRRARASEVRSSGGRTLERSSPGALDELVEFVAFGDSSEGAASANQSYQEIASDR